MKWTENESDNSHYCNTPIGKYTVFEGFERCWLFLNDEKLGGYENVETAKEDARTHLFTTYYRLKLFLELHE